MSFVVSARSGPKRFDETTQTADIAERAAREADIAQRVKRELAKTRAQAEAQGREAGYAEGFAIGKSEAESAMQSAAAALHQATAQLAAPLALKQSDLADLITDLARALAAHIISTEVTTSLAPITNLATELLTQAAAERQPKNHISLRLNPNDHAALSAVVLPPVTTLTPDPAIAQGGALLEITQETTHPITIWDATLPTRLASLTAP
jgi:flagellar assembly protein FliH